MFISIQTAIYGTLTTGKDVTSEVEALVLSGKNRFQITNTTMAGDPDPGTTKYFAVSYMKDDGSLEYRAAREGDTIDIS